MMDGMPINSGIMVDHYIFAKAWEIRFVDATILAGIMQLQGVFRLCPQQSYLFSMLLLCPKVIGYAKRIKE